MRKCPMVSSSFWFSLHVRKVNLVHLFMSKREGMWPALPKSLFSGRFVFDWEKQFDVILVSLARVI